MKKAVCLTLLLLGGCKAWTNNPPIERFAMSFVDGVVAPSVKEGLRQGVENLTVQAGAQGINPTYVVEFEGKWVVGVEGRVTAGVEGIAGQIQITSLAGEKTRPSPFLERTSTSPVSPAPAPGIGGP